MVLAAQRIAHPLITRQYADTADAPVACEPGVEQPVKIHRLVRAVEAANAEMRNADADLAAVIVRDRDVEGARVGCG
ncbi:hypothetical protein NJB18091_39550 [Mycobacterium marinum]|nr:hypothetical protein NJB18091_39550 [Mycobacterium marinum]